MNESLIAKLRIGAEERSEGSGGVFEHLHPFTREVQAKIPLAGRKEVDEAVAKAAAVADEWRRWKPSARRSLLLRLADLVEQHVEQFALLSTLDVGIPITNGVFLNHLAAEFIRYYAGWTDKLDGDLLSKHETHGELAYTLPEPYGIVGIIITWNGPLLSLGMKVAPALAAGNCVIVKPSELTPFSPDLFARLVRDAGFPDGVLSMLPGGSEAGEALVMNERVEKISFTGGPAAASKILAGCALQMKPAVLELGGKSANIVFPDAEDFERICQRATSSSIGIMAGQGCALGTRMLVHADVYDQVLSRVLEIVRSFKVGDPLDPSTRVGPVVNEAAVQRILGMFDRARADRAATFALGGQRVGGDLLKKPFIAPTVLTDVDPKHEIAQVEIFGPVLLVQRFRTEEEAVALANGTRYGLAAYIHSGNARRCHRLAERLRSGGVYINGGSAARPEAPFGGLGISGYGKEGGRAGINEFLRYKTVSMA